MGEPMCEPACPQDALPSQFRQYGAPAMLPRRMGCRMSSWRGHRPVVSLRSPPPTPARPPTRPACDMRGVFRCLPTAPCLAPVQHRPGPRTRGVVASADRGAPSRRSLLLSTAAGGVVVAAAAAGAGGKAAMAAAAAPEPMDILGAAPADVLAPVSAIPRAELAPGLEISRVVKVGGRVGGWVSVGCATLLWGLRLVCGISHNLSGYKTRPHLPCHRTSAPRRRPCRAAGS